jgi:hypothetical protein
MILGAWLWACERKQQSSSNGKANDLIMNGRETANLRRQNAPYISQSFGNC